MSMPIYEYQCKSCGSEHSQLLKWEQDPDPCPCGDSKLEKKLAAPVLRMGGIKSMSTRHTTSEYYGPNRSGGTMKMATEQYFPEEVKAKEKEFKKKQEGKGATVSISKVPNKK